MTKEEELRRAIEQLTMHLHLRYVLGQMLYAGELANMRVYVYGLYHMAMELTSDESILSPLRKLRDLLK